jgi:predicted glycosyltransferase
MTYLFYFGHPSQYLFLRETIKRLAKSGDNRIVILIKTKDVLEYLLKNDGFEYINISPRERGKSKPSIALSLLRRNLKLFPILLRTKPDLLIGTDASLAQLGRLLNINRITIVEDDYSVIKTLANLTYPFTKTILCPEVCDVGKWENKKTAYKGYMKLGYLHPNVFKPDGAILSKYILPHKYVLIRLVRLTAHHDFGMKGINPLLLGLLISIIQ